MKRLATFDGEKLVAAPPYSVAENRLVEEQRITEHEDTSVSPLSVRLFDVVSGDGVLLAANGTPLVERFTIQTPKAEQVRLMTKLSELAIHGLRDDCYEIWGSGHNVHDYDVGGFHIADKQNGPVSWLLRHLQETLVASGHPVTPPPFNHDKVSFKKKPVLDVTGTHVDSFEGMRTDNSGDRLQMWRYFINLSDKPRSTLIAPLDPQDVSKTIPLDWSETYLDPLFTSLGKQMDMLKVTLEPADFSTGALQVFRTTTTHLPHAEYGYPNDTLAVIDSLD